MIERHTLLVSACGLSAGVHAGLLATHLAESPVLAVAFGAAALLLVVVAVALAVRPQSAWAAAGAAIAFAALLVSYVVVEHEPFGALAAATKLVEAAGLALALYALRTPVAARPHAVSAVTFGVALAFGLMLAGAGAHG